MSSRSSTNIRLPFRIAFGSFALLGAVALAAPQSASAYSATGTAANTVITNTATVTYNNAGGLAQTPIPVSATVTVTQVKANPTLSAPLDQTIDPGGNAVYSYTITANANGNDNYTLATLSVVNSIGITTASSGVLSTTAISNLGSTIAAAAAIITATAITVPADGVVDASVNGIVAGDKVLIGGNVYTVASVVDNAVGTSTINLTAGLSTAVTLGDAIYEQQTFTLTVTPGTVVATSNQTVTTTITGKYNGSGSTVSDVTTTFVQVAALTVAKVVSTDGATGAVYAGNANAAPGAIVTYRITITNAVGGSTAKAVTITDPISAYTAFNTGTCKVTSTAGSTYAAAGAAITDGVCGYAAGTITYVHGDLLAGASVVLFFQATIK